MWARVADLLALVLLLFALLSAARGGMSIDWGPVHLAMTRSSRLLAEAFALLLVRQALWPSPGRRGRVLFVSFLAGLLCGLSGESRPRRIGDGLEYLAMALNLAHGSPPALTPDELRLAAARLGEAGELIRMPLLQGPDGRQDFPHFWFYPLLAAPFVRVADALGVNPTFGFTALNIVLLCCAAWMMAARLPPPAVLLIVGSPILWWVDKAHTEVFTVALLSTAAALLALAPPWALPVLATAATQNPPLVVLLGLAFVYVAWVASPRDERLRISVPLAIALSLLHPLYYGWRLGRWSPLLQGTTPHVPTVPELTAVLWDPNLGILSHFPALAVVFAFGLVSIVRASGWRRPGLWFLLAAAAFLLFAFAQTANFNHGGTLSPSRYGLWLIPFAVSALLTAESLLGRRGFALFALASFVWSVISFQPRLTHHHRLPEGYLVPSPLAQWIWTKAPGLDNPLPEVFVERVGEGETWTLPVATTRCEKALLPGIGWPMGLWPLQCTPVPLPTECVPPGALCYANRGSEGYAFVRAPRQASFFFFVDPRWTWRAQPREATLRLLARIPWEELRRVDAGQPGTYVVGRDRVGPLAVLQSERALLAWVDRPRIGARLFLRLPRRMSGLVVAPHTGGEYERLDIAANTDAAVGIPWEWPMAMLLVAEGVPPR